MNDALTLLSGKPPAQRRRVRATSGARRPAQRGAVLLLWRGAAEGSAERLPRHHSAGSAHHNTQSHTLSQLAQHTFVTSGPLTFTKAVRVIIASSPLLQKINLASVSISDREVTIDDRRLSRYVPSLTPSAGCATRRVMLAPPSPRFGVDRSERGGVPVSCGGAQLRAHSHHQFVRLLQHRCDN